MLADLTLQYFQEELLLHRTCGVRAVTFRTYPWSGREQPYCLECELWIDPTYAKLTVVEELF